MHWARPLMICKLIIRKMSRIKTRSGTSTRSTKRRLPLGQYKCSTFQNISKLHILDSSRILLIKVNVLVNSSKIFSSSTMTTMRGSMHSRKSRINFSIQRMLISGRIRTRWGCQRLTRMSCCEILTINRWLLLLSSKNSGNCASLTLSSLSLSIPSLKPTKTGLFTTWL